MKKEPLVIPLKADTTQLKEAIEYAKELRDTLKEANQWLDRLTSREN